MSTLPPIRPLQLSNGNDDMNETTLTSVERRKPIEATSAISPMKPSLPPRKEPAAVGERLHKQQIGNPRKPIRRMRSRSADALNIEQLNADIQIRRRLDFMSTTSKQPELPTPKAPASPVKSSGPRRPSRPTLIRKSSQDDSNLQLRSQRRPSYELAASPFDRCSMFSVKRYVSPSNPDSTKVQAAPRKSRMITNIKNGLEKGMMKCVYTGPAVFWKKRLTLTVSVYLHAAEHDCFEVVPIDHSQQVSVPRLFVRPSVLFKLKEKAFQSKLASVAAHRKDLLEQSRLHLAGEIIVSLLRIDSDESTPFVEGDPTITASGTATTNCISTSAIKHPNEPTNPPGTESSHRNAEGGGGESANTAQSEEISASITPAQTVKVFRELILSLPHYNEDSLAFESINIPRPLNLPLCF